MIRSISELEGKSCRHRANPKSQPILTDDICGALGSARAQNGSLPLMTLRRVRCLHPKKGTTVIGVTGVVGIWIRSGQL